MGGISILRHFRLPDRPHYHPRIFFCSAAIFGRELARFLAASNLRPIKPHFVGYLRRWFGRRCVSCYPQPGIYFQSAHNTPKKVSRRLDLLHAHLAL